MQGQGLIAAAIAAFQECDLERARRLAEEALAKSEQLPLLHHLLGLIDCRLGRFDEGIENLKRAMKDDPTNLSYRITLARALIDGGRSDEALKIAAPPSGQTPAELELWRVRAEAAFYAGQRTVEEAAWRAICDTRPQDAMAWTNLARSLLAQYRFAEAEAAYLQALAIAPVLTVRHELGLALERSNRLDQLGVLLDTALADGVPKEQLADLWALRALRAGDVEEAVRLAEMIDIRPDPFRLNGLKAKIYDSANRPAEAFMAATAMNWSVANPAEWRARGRAFRDELRARDRGMTGWVPEQRLVPSLPRSPAFVVGFPRSGTTLTDTFLSGHPDIRVIDEVPLLETAARTLGGIAQLPAATTEELTAARDAYFRGVDAHVEATFDGVVIDKIALNMLSLPLIASLFPDARIIFAQRHPCDCVLSCYMQPFILNNAMASFRDLTDAADLYDAAMSLFFRARDRMNLPTHTLVYEDLVADPTAALRPVIDFLGLDWRAELLDHRATAARRDAIKTPSYDSVSEPLSKRPSGRWRRYEAQLAPVLSVLLPWAERLGYVD
jgi:Flp pilus assembly protein TadD